MKRAIQIYLLFSVFINYFSPNASGQKPWTLEECISHAWDNNIGIKQQEISLLLSKYDYNQSIVNLFPTLNASATNVYNYGQTLDLYTNQFASNRVRSNNFYVSSGITVFNGFKLLNTIKQKQLDFLSEKYDLEKIKNDMALAIATIYLQVLYNHELKDISERQLAITRLQVERTRILCDAGSLAKGELLNLEAQMTQEEYQLVTSVNQLDISYLTLMQMLDLNISDSFTIEKPELNIQDASALLGDPQEIYQKALGIMPELKSAELKVQSAQKGKLVAYGSFSPVIAVTGSWGTGYSGASQEVVNMTPSDYVIIGATSSGEPVYSQTYQYGYQVKTFADQIKDNENKSVGIYLSIPLFNNYRNHYSCKAAKLSLLSAELNLQNTEMEIYKTIQQAYADARAALNRYYAAKKSLDAYSEAFYYAEEKYNAGVLNTIDYNTAKNNLLASQSDLLQAKYEYVFRIKVLDFYQGKPITLESSN